ncbi:diguanylate cyclase [Ramlibacter sp. MMS24-I3-19]|uniref:diguanylate cyclase n=1 Tax=Ramlibacter sp. MMS24-I3-19 TaxID=3416606 RepID=UPI003CFCC371
MAHPAALLVVTVVYPLWVGAGLADWACHRATRIATTSGLRENLLHQLMFVQMGLAIAAMALLQVNAGVLVLVGVLFLLHEATVWWDLRVSLPVRRVSAIEQMVHSFQELLPLVSPLLLMAMTWDQALALVGLGSEPADLRLRWKDDPLPPALLVGGAALAAVCNALPLAQETLACLRARRSRA